jgi:hypothetical protein
MPQVTTIREGVDTFLKNRLEHSPFLIPLWSPELETQFMVYPGSNEADEADSDGDEESAIWTDGEQKWFSHRWPKNAWGDAHYKDKPLTFSPGVHIQAVGTTWWNYVQQRSVALAFDIDAVEGHSATTTTNTQEQLDQFLEAARSLPYITIIRSKSGNGYHVYVFFDPADQPVTRNHNEHATLAVCVLGKMSEDASFPFNEFIDVKGGNFWIWADKRGQHGFELVQGAVHPLRADELGDWQAAVLATPNRPVVVEGFTDSGEATTHTMQGGGFKVYPMEEAHKKILRELETLGYAFRWFPEFNMAHTHTAALKILMENRLAAGSPLKGVFETASGGKDKSKPNCYITPRPKGAFRVARHGVSAAEHSLWETYENDTWCFYNQEASVLRVLQKLGGHELVFSSGELEKALNLFGQTLGENHTDISVPIQIKLNRSKNIFTAHFSGDILDKSTGEPAKQFKNWQKKAKGYERLLPLRHDPKMYTQTVLEGVDQYVRYLTTAQDNVLGWLHAVKHDRWITNKNYEAGSAIVQQRYGPQLSNDIKASLVTNPWTLVHRPFEQEYPDDPDLRLWNRKAPQLKYTPSLEPGPHATWDYILGHLGNSLTPTIRETEWCSKWGIATGADYLRFWVACLIKYPFIPLPYLFFFGPQNTGKSTLFECFTLIFTPGSVKSAGNALMSQAGFNSELGGVVIAFIDEKNLSMSGKQAYERIKEWTMAETLTIHPKGLVPYEQPNTLHFIQVGNSIKNLPLEDGDTRVTAIEVNPFRGEVIPKDKLFMKLREEAPYFLRTLITTSIPDQIGRTRLPVLDTAAKMDLQSMNQSDVERAASENLFCCPGSLVKVSEFYNSYRNYCMVGSLAVESAISVSRQMQTRSDLYLIGVGKGNQNYIANVSLERTTPHSEPYVLCPVTHRLKRESQLELAGE